MAENVINTSRRMVPVSLKICLSAAFLLAACSEKERILPGAREDLFPHQKAQADAQAPLAASRLPALSLPAVSRNGDWLQRIGTPSTRTAHPALGRELGLAWSVKVGQGHAKRARLTADPVVGSGRIHTLDSASRVSAVSLSGAVLWSRALVPDQDKAQDASGGGLALHDGTLFASTGFGRITALEAATGEPIWTQKLDSAGAGAPAVAGDLVYVVGGDRTAWALDAKTGRVRWQLDASPDEENINHAAAPAIGKQLVVLPFGVGEVVGAFRQGGLRLWSATIAGQRPGVAASLIGDITGDPVIAGDVVYTANFAGRLVALRLGNGERIWTAEEGALDPVWPAGNAVFLVSERNELLRLDRDSGTKVWGVKLPYFTKNRPRRQARVFAHYGPVLAGQRLLVASGDGFLRSYDPRDGALLSEVAVPGGAGSAPVVAGGRVYLLSAKGNLLAYQAR